MNVSGPEGPPIHAPGFTFSRVTDDRNLIESLQRVAAAGRDLLPNAIGASITVVIAGRAHTMAATDPIAADLDQAQYEPDDGPCLTAARTERSVRIDRVSDDHRWPVFRRTAEAHDVASSLSLPMLIEDPSALGALNLYSSVPAGFSDDDEATVEAFAGQAAVAVANVVAYWEAFALGDNLTRAMEHRGVIEQAKGVLMATRRCSPDDAFAILRQRSQAENRKLRDVAIDVVAEAQRT
jgi:GAF domain-containing protein